MKHLKTIAETQFPSIGDWTMINTHFFEALFIGDNVPASIVTEDL